MFIMDYRTETVLIEIAYNDGVYITVLREWTGYQWVIDPEFTARHETLSDAKEYAEGLVAYSKGED